MIIDRAARITTRRKPKYPDPDGVLRVLEWL
jgi:hypothetical protein